MAFLFTVGCGFIFAIGLGLSGMTDANKVIGFLNISDQWDPSLAFVMVGAIGVHAIGYFLITKRPSPLFTNRFHFPAQTLVNNRLLVGAALFGTGWGLGGYCPGPALVSAVSAGHEALVFCGAMLAGMLIHEWGWHRPRRRTTEPPA